MEYILVFHPSGARGASKSAPGGLVVVVTGGLTFRMIQIAQYLSVTDPPITPERAGYTGRAAISKEERPGGLPSATAYT